MAGDPPGARSRLYAFGPFRLFPAQQMLLEGDKPVRLGSRACEILATLVERPGQLFSNRELMARVWPNTFVEEGNLRVHMAALRRALGDGQAGKRYITNTPGRGYCFGAPVDLSEDAAEAAGHSGGAERQLDMPAPLARAVGRSDIVRELAAQLPRRRFITVVGPGGIGKTTVAVAVADALLDSFRDGVRFVDLAPLSDPLLVPSALAAQLGVGVRSDRPLPSLIGFLRDKQLLVVLDNCEHVIDGAATLAEEMFVGAKETHILATSREALRAEGEHVHRLSPLTLPADVDGLGAAEALEYAAVQLFVERAAASLGSFELSDAEAPLVADICRRLDGIALAIEIAAGRVDAFGVAGLAARLNDRFRLLLQGRRTALPRHRTLGAALDWSHDLLPDFERVALRRLAVFAGTFTMESASAILAETDMSSAEAVDAVADLVAKSLVSASVDGAIAFYRLLDTTRAYALAKLDESGEANRLARLHAEHYLTLLEGAQADWETRPATEWLERHRHLVDNVRAGLDWAFSAAGDPVIGVALTLAAVPLWFELSLVSECAERIDRAVDAAASRDPDRDMRLHAARAWSLMQTKGFVSETRAAWGRVLELAEQQGDVDYQLRALWGLWADLVNRGELRPALALAERFSEIAARRPDGTDGLVGDRIVGYTLHLLGDQGRARRYIEGMLSRYQVPVVGAQMIRFVFDQRGMAQCFLARILWLQGFADRAMGLVRSIIDSAADGDDVLSLCQALVQAGCPVAFLVGDLSAAERYVTMLLDSSARQALDFWHAFGRSFQGVLLAKQGDIAAGVALLGTALDELRDIRFGVLYGVFLGEFASALGRAGRISEGLEAVDEALARSERNDERWYVAELLRIKGELVWRQPSSDAPRDAERCFLESPDWARRQETAAWELRTAVSLGRLWRDQSRADEARRLVAPSYARFTEGFATADLRAARQLLEEMGDVSHRAV